MFSFYRYVALFIGVSLFIGGNIVFFYFIKMQMHSDFHVSPYVKNYSYHK